MSRYQVNSASEYDYGADDDWALDQAIYRVWDDAEKEVDAMTPNELFDHFEHDFMDRALKRFESMITRYQISEDDAAEFALQLWRNDSAVRYEMINLFAERLAADTV